MDQNRKDSIATIAAIGLLAYASADVTHHALGHGAACLALGGRIISLSSHYVDCSLHGAAIDLSGPFANLLIGGVAMLAAGRARRRASSTVLFCLLAAAFNLLWFMMQLAFSAATRTDDWAWAMHQLQVPELLRFVLIAVGAVGYVMIVRVTAVQMAPFARPRARAARITVTAWLTAGAIACATAAFDPAVGTLLLRHILEQSLGLSIGLLFVPARAASLAAADRDASVLNFSWGWIGAAAIVGAASIALLGPGIAV
jgi:hypothetical protein